MRSTKNLKILLLALLIGGIVSCVRTGELREETKAIQLGEAKSVEVELEMGVGELELQGGARELMEGTFTYNVKRWEPKVVYRVIGDRGMLSVNQGKTSGIPIGNLENRWDISLSNDVPLDLEVDFGAGDGELDLRGIILNSLNIDMGVGELTLDLSGERDRNLDVTIDGGIGSGTIYLPENISVRAEIDGGIGSINARRMNKRGNIYTNDAYGKADIYIDIKIDAGIGSIDLKLK